LVLLIGLSLVGSTSYALYLTTIGPAECCRSHCHHGHPTSKADADRCCATHLSVVPSALGPAAPDVSHALVASATTMPVVFSAPPIVHTMAPSPGVRLRGSPTGSLVAAHTALLI
jgi:hypothetical protein